VEVGAQWREAWTSTLLGKATLSIPAAIEQWWKTFCRGLDRSFMDAARDSQIVAAAQSLCVASDIACEGLGVTPSKDPFLAISQAVLDRNERRSFCMSITPDKLAVLGKQHTPQRGCTIRSLTHHLSLYPPSEIKAYWAGPFEPAMGELDVLNLLLLPWPTDVKASDFRIVARRLSDAGSDTSHRYFEYHPSSHVAPTVMGRRVACALANARAHADKIHGIVLPELALNSEQFEAVERVAVAEGAMLISGVRTPASESPKGMPLNMCAIQPLGLTAVPLESRRRRSRLWDETRRVQLKHHRWCLDRNQIMQYGLGGRLPASRDCWERIFLGERTIYFVTLGSWLTVCVLLCEDLARQDPVADVIRAVGPNLVFALLMDGPQLRHRWPSRYASVLAEDPGCSVLPLTSLGMAKRSRPRDSEETPAADRSSVIALWRDAIFGERELLVEPNHDACVLSLVCRSTREYTLDGRGEDQSHFPVFAGAYSFRSEGDS